LRLQLLEPDKYPYLPKCLYGLLMILPQSSAFVSLRARLSVVHSSGYVPTPSKTCVHPNLLRRLPLTWNLSAGLSTDVRCRAPSAFPAAPRSKLGTEIKWQELLSRESWRRLTRKPHVLIAFSQTSDPCRCATRKLVGSCTPSTPRLLRSTIRPPPKPTSRHQTLPQRRYPVHRNPLRSRRSRCPAREADRVVDLACRR
jgi:hypothetical protein